MGRLLARPVTIAVGAGLLVCAMASCGSDGKADPADGSRGKAAAERYRAYLEESAAGLAAAVDELIGPIRSGKVPRTMSLYVIARVDYGHLEAVADSFGRLGSRINARVGAVPESELGGFHRIEKALWAEGTTRKMKPVVRQLLDDVEQLQRRLRGVGLSPARIVAFATRLLDEVSSSKLAGKEQPYADADLVDVAANLEGAEAAFEAVKPALADDGRSLRAIEARFEEIYGALSRYGTLAREPNQYRRKAAGAIFVTYSELSKGEIRQLTRPIEALAELFAQAGDQFASTRFR
ncbi:MAG TPA: EfeM/EfeO family lipoprotein [Acidimicrobiia bacterium]|nr:EfeM/EfeO family lipoprotein [Acidimicrobiia bacterium]